MLFQSVESFLKTAADVNGKIEVDALVLKSFSILTALGLAWGIVLLEAKLSGRLCSANTARALC